HSPASHSSATRRSADLTRTARWQPYSTAGQLSQTLDNIFGPRRASRDLDVHRQEIGHRAHNPVCAGKNSAVESAVAHGHNEPGRSEEHTSELQSRFDLV